MSFIPRFLSRTSLSTLSLRSMSSASVAPLLLSPAQVNELVQTPKPVSILDATWFMPNSPRNARQEYLSRRLPGAQFLDLDKVASPNELGLKHMMPSERIFADACEQLGVMPSSHVILYDAHGVFSSPRALFMFRAFGHLNSSIIDGGLPRWQGEGLPMEVGPPKDVTASIYPTPAFDAGSIKSYEQIVSNSLAGPVLSTKSEIVLDARSQGRYLGQDSEPRPGLPSGHIPHSLSLPFTVFLRRHRVGEHDYTTLLPQPELYRELENSIGPEVTQLIVQGKRPVITSCGSGMTAGVLWLVLKLLEVGQVAIYDESWTGYAMRPSSTIETNK